MELFLAESGSMFKVVYKHGRSFEGLNILQSFWYCDKFTEEVLIPQAKNFLLDSGAFSARQAGKGNLDYVEWIERYSDFINRNGVTRFFEMDVDNVIGYESVLKLRSMLEGKTGRRCIPVWHVSRGKDDFLRMCEEYGYVALGGIVGSGKVMSRYKEVMPWLVREAHKRGCKIHGLGFTSMNEVRKMGFDTVDSSSWSSSVRFGSMHVFNGAGMVTKKASGGKRVNDYKTAACHNFDEWVKYMKYARKHL